MRRLGSGYQELFDRLHAAVEPDQRVRGFWLSGSLAKGSADVGSDLDVLLALRDEDAAAFRSGWRTWLEPIAMPLLAQELPFAEGCYTVLSSECLRLDVISETPEQVAESGHRHRLVVFDRDGLDALVPGPLPDRGPDLEQVERIVQEAFRLIAIFPQAVLGRNDWLLGVSGVQLQRSLLYDLFVEVNRPLPSTGVKQYSAKLTASQREVLLGLPAVAPDRSSLLSGMRATVAAWNGAGRTALDSVGVAWPERLAETVTSYFERSA